MSIHGSIPSDDEETTMRASSQVHQPSWMSHWMKGSSKEALTLDRKTYSAPNGVKIGEVPSRSCTEVLTRNATRNLSNKSEALQNEISNSSVPTFRLYRNAENNSTMKTQVNPESGPETMSLALSIGREATTTDLNYLPNPKFRSSGKHEATSTDLNFLPDHKFKSNKKHEATTTDLNYVPNNMFRSGEKHGLYNIYEQGKGAAVSGTFGQPGSTSHALPHPSHHEDVPQPIVVFEKHFSNDNFSCLDQDNCMYKKYSSCMIHDKNMKNDPSCELRDNNRLDVQHGPSSNKNFQAFFKRQPSNSVQSQANGRYFPTNGSLSNIHQTRPYHEGHRSDTYPWPVRNVETMRICTMVDSMETGDTHNISQRSRHYLFTKETCFNISGHQALREPYASTHSEEKTFTRPFSMAPSNPGVKIQPLWTSTDSDEQEDTDKPSVFKAGSRNEASGETNGMQVEAPKNQDTLLGTASSLLQKNDTMHEDSSSAAYGSNREKTRSKRLLTEIPDMNEESSSVACDSSREKSRNKRPLLEIPDMNEELPGPQPAVSSTDGKESSTSRVHSLNAKHLFPCGEHASKSESNSRKNRPLALESSNRWIKRLRLNSSDSFGVGTKNSDIEEGSSPEKFNLFFNKIAKCNKESFDPEARKHSTEQMVLKKNEDFIRNGESSSMVPKKRNESVMQGCSWMQRWSQRSNCLLPKTPEPLVICEPHKLKFGQDDPSRKQFPSIAALALMGKAMNGIRSCEFKKRGPVVVWNTKEYSD